MRQISQWRTYTAVLILAMMLLIGMMVICAAGDAVAAAATTIYVAYSASIVSLGGVLAGKAAIEHAWGKRANTVASAKAEISKRLN
jgi:hypothetical protein